MRELNELYQAVLLDHARQPRNHRRLENATAIGEGHNPDCGDKCKVYLGVSQGVIKDVSVEGAGCAIMMASASLMTLGLVSKTLEQAQEIAEQFQKLVTTETILDDETLGDLAAFASVKDMPSRIKCAMLPWRAMRRATERI